MTCDWALQSICTNRNNCVWKFEAQCNKKWNNHVTHTYQNWHVYIKMKGALTLQDNGGEVATFVCTLCWPDTKHNVTFNLLIVLYLVFDLIHDVYIYIINLFLLRQNMYSACVTHVKVLDYKYGIWLGLYMYWSVLIFVYIWCTINPQQI